jgi:pyrroloquinoline quinone biosynthesis protein B
MVLFDGTLWRDDELIAAGLGQKIGTRMGHMSMSGETGSMAVLDQLDIGRKIFIHINNSNPVLHPASPERAELERRGWTIPADGMEFTL